MRLLKRYTAVFVPFALFTVGCDCGGGETEDAGKKKDGGATYDAAMPDNWSPDTWQPDTQMDFDAWTPPDTWTAPDVDQPDTYTEPDASPDPDATVGPDAVLEDAFVIVPDAFVAEDATTADAFVVVEDAGTDPDAFVAEDAATMEDAATEDAGAPPAMTCADPGMLMLGDQTGDTTGGAESIFPSESIQNVADNIWTITPDCDSRTTLTLTTTGGFDGLLCVYLATDCNLEPTSVDIACVDNIDTDGVETLTVDLTQGLEYVVVVTSAWEEVGAYTLNYARTCSTCGDTECNTDEDCLTCEQDCGACSTLSCTTPGALATGDNTGDTTGAPDSVYPEGLYPNASDNIWQIDVTCRTEMTLNLETTDWDGMVCIYASDKCNLNDTNVACMDDEDETGIETLVHTVEAGTYYIAVTGWEPEEVGAYTLRYTDECVLYCNDGMCNNDETCETCPNDCGACQDCTAPEALVRATTNQGDTTGARNELNASCDDGGNDTPDDIWTFTAACDGFVDVELTANFSAVVSMYADSADCTGAELACGNTPDELNAVAIVTGTVYHVAVSGYDADDAGTYGLTFDEVCAECGDSTCEAGYETCSTCPQDCGECPQDCENAGELTKGVAVSSTTIGGSEHVLPLTTCTSAGVADEVWYFDLECDGEATLTQTTTTAGFDSALVIFADAYGNTALENCLSGGNHAVCYDESLDGAGESITAGSLTAGRYYVAVTGYDVDDEGDYTITYTNNCPECSDGTCNGDETCDTCPADCGACKTCAAPAALVKDATNVGDTTGALDQVYPYNSVNTFCTDQYVKDDIWSFDTACEGDVTITLTSPDFDGSLAIYNDVAACSDSMIADLTCDYEDSGVDLVLTGTGLSASTTHYVVVTGAYADDAGGPYTLTYTDNCSTSHARTCQDPEPLDTTPGNANTGEITGTTTDTMGSDCEDTGDGDEVWTFVNTDCDTVSGGKQMRFVFPQSDMTYPTATVYAGVLSCEPAPYSEECWDNTVHVTGIAIGETVTVAVTGYGDTGTYTMTYECLDQ